MKIKVLMYACYLTKYNNARYLFTEYHNHGDVSINLKMVRTLDAAYRSMKSEKLEIA